MNKSKAHTEIKIARNIESYLLKLCDEIPNRHTGSAGNRQASDFFAETMASFGFTIEQDDFDCMDWEYGNVKLQAGNESYEAFVSPYSMPFSGAAELICVSLLDELQKADFNDKLLLLHGDIAKEQMMPKNFPFYNPDEHQQIISLLEEKKPAAIICATGKNPELAGAWYPFPMFEDGDFNIPSVYMKDIDGSNLLRHRGSEVSLSFESRRISAKGTNVIARKNEQAKNKIVFCAHIDAKKGTPGALDNAAGISTLLALGGLLKDSNPKYCIEITAFNGEDYFAASGQIQYLSKYADTFEKIKLVVNIDGAGYFDGNTAFSLYECPKSISNTVEQVLKDYHGIKKGGQWYQGDHMVFVQNNVPALAFTTSNFLPVWTEIAHTEKDVTDMVEPRKLAEAACVMKEIALNLK